MQIPCTFTESTQTTNSRHKCLWNYFWLRCIHKINTLKYFFFIISSVHCMHIFEKNGVTKTIDYTFGQISTFPLAVTRMRTLSMEPNIKESTVLFLLRYIRYKGRLKSQIWDSKVYPWLHRQVNHQVHWQMHLFLYKTCFWKWNLRCTFNWVTECLLKFTFNWSVLRTLLH